MLILNREGNLQSSEKGSDKILAIIRNDNKATINDISEQVGLSTRAVEKQLKKIRESGIITRIDSRKENSWKIN